MPPVPGVGIGVGIGVGVGAGIGAGIGVGVGGPLLPPLMPLCWLLLLLELSKIKSSSPLTFDTNIIVITKKHRKKYLKLIILSNLRNYYKILCLNMVI
jgi:hypothetical protein